MKKFLLVLLSIFVLIGCTDTNDKDIINPDITNPDGDLNDDSDSDSSPDDSNEYFEVLDLEYTGPYIDDKFYEITELTQRIEGNDKLLGTGIVFDVTLKYTVDGDTAWFDVPYEYKDIYKSSFRFLNMDTEETYTNPEEWGKPASNYTADLLTNAHSIKLQNDPGDSVVDAYDRGLIWVWIQETPTSDYELLNYKVTQQGLASVAYLYGAGESIYYNNTSYTNWMYKAQNEAKANKRGMHSDLLDPFWDYESGSLLFTPLF